MKQDLGPLNKTNTHVAPAQCQAQGTHSCERCSERSWARAPPRVTHTGVISPHSSLVPGRRHPPRTRLLRVPRPPRLHPQMLPPPASQHVWEHTRRQLSLRPASPSGFPISDAASPSSGAVNLKVLGDTCPSLICCSQSVRAFCCSLETPLRCTLLPPPPPLEPSDP